MHECPSDGGTDSTAVVVSYTLLRHLGLMLDELSAQGLEVWQEGQSWYWRWSGTAYAAKRGMWALGEAVVDAVVTRYPEVFDTQPSDSAD